MCERFLVAGVRMLVPMASNSEILLTYLNVDAIPEFFNYHTYKYFTFGDGDEEVVHSPGSGSTSHVPDPDRSIYTHCDPIS
jgi:hypothetical protein